MSSKEWKKYKLGDLVDDKRGISYGIVQPGEFLKEGGVPILKVNNLTENKTDLKDVYRVTEAVESKYARTRLRGDEILVSLVGSLGHVFKATEKQKGWNVVRAIGVLPIKNEINRDWIYWCLKSQEVQTAFTNNATVTVQATLNLKELREIEIPFPNTNIQQRIVAILSALDDKIELNRQTNATLEAIAQAIFKEWFVDFRFPDATDEMQESELGSIPVGWSISELGRIYRTVSGGTPSRNVPEFFENGTINWIKSKEITGSFIIDTEEKITEKALLRSSAKLLPAYSVLIAMYGATVGEFGITHMEAACNQAICAFLPNEEFPFTFIYHVLKFNKDEIISKAVGSAQQNISQDVLRHFKIILPPVSILQEFHRAAHPLFKLIENNLEQSRELVQIRDTLLPKLTSGELLV